MQRAVKDSFMILRLQDRAKRKAVNGVTGTAKAGNITVVYYPGCQRFAWFDESGVITKKLAVKLLEASDKWIERRAP